jgi:hypothetical protein
LQRKPALATLFASADKLEDTMKMFISLAALLVLGGILGASPTTKPSINLTDKQILAPYEVTLKAGQTRDGKPRRNGVVKTVGGSRVSVGIVGEEGHPILIGVPSMTLVPGDGESNADELKVAETIFCNVVGKDQKPLFVRMVRDLMDGRKRGETDVTRDFGDVRVKLDFMPQNDESSVDVNFTLTPKP